MRYSILALAVVPLLVSSVRPGSVDLREAVVVSADSCAAKVDSAMQVARDRTTSTTLPAQRSFFFEHELTVRAARVGTPAPSTTPDSGAIVQFVVDTAGRVDTSTVRLLAARGSRMGRTELATLIGGWPFTPGRVAGCPIAQLVQMSVR